MATGGCATSSGPPDAQPDRSGAARLRRRHFPKPRRPLGDPPAIAGRARLRPGGAAGEAFEIAPRPVAIYRFALVAAGRDEARFEADCGKGAYVRALARDLGRMLGCYGHVVFLRRLRVGLFAVAAAIGLEAAEASSEACAAALQPVDAGLAELPRLAIDRNGAAILRRGQKLLLRGAALPSSGPAYARRLGAPIAFGAIEDGYFVSTRVFNLRA